MNVQETTEIRDLKSAELDEVTGASASYEFLSDWPFESHQPVKLVSVAVAGAISGGIGAAGA